MTVQEYIQLLNCTATFIEYGKDNVLSIFNWEQAVLLKIAGQQATLLYSYDRWNTIENKIVSGKGVELDIDGVDEKVRFFDVSQTHEPKYKRETKSKKAEDGEIQHFAFQKPVTEDIVFGHKHRKYLLTALWQELGTLQEEYERSSQTNVSSGTTGQDIGQNNGYMLLKHISVIYIMHKHHKSCWHNENEVETAYNAYLSFICKDTVDFSPDIISSHLQGQLFAEIYQAALNLLTKIEKRFFLLLKNSETDDAENYYLTDRFYKICQKDKVGIARLKPGKKITTDLSLSAYEVVEILPYTPGMEREAFFEYLQSLLDSRLTEEYIVLVRKKTEKNTVIVTTYRIEVGNWATKQRYVDFDIETTRYPISYFLRPVESEVINGGASNGGDNKGVIMVSEQPAKAAQESGVSAQIAEKVAVNHKNQKKDNQKEANKHDTGSKKSKNPQKKRVDVMRKISKFNEDIRNKSC